MARPIHRGDGAALDATFGVESVDGKVTVVVESRGGARGQPGARNIDYSEGLEVLLGRLQDRGARILDAVVDTLATRQLPHEVRRLAIDGRPYPVAIDDPSELQRRIRAAQTGIGREEGARGAGNSTKRIRLYLGLDSGAPSNATLEAELAGRRPEPRYWAFFANPRIYRVEQALEASADDSWLTAGREIQAGDRAIIWRGRGADGRRGVVALAEVTSDPLDLDDSGNPYWVEPQAPKIEARVRVRYVTPPGVPLWLDQHEATLGDLSITAARGGTVFNVRPEQWDAVVALAGGWPSATTTARRHVGRPYTNIGRVPPAARREPFEVDPDKVDRGLQGHASTQDALADFLRGQGLDPRSPVGDEPEFDLAWVRDGTTFVAEVKSLVIANEERQLRLGLGQVLRYRQRLSGGNGRVIAVLVPERRPSEGNWEDLCNELGILLVWPGSFETLVANPTDVLAF
jgi:hypothetical protein